MPPKDTLNINYIVFKESLPENLRLTPEKDYHMYDYWRLSGEPENFTEGKQIVKIIVIPKKLVNIVVK